jgi:hypothetical protein
MLKKVVLQPGRCSAYMSLGFFFEEDAYEYNNLQGRVNKLRIQGSKGLSDGDVGWQC